MTALITCAANSSPTAMFCGFSSDWLRRVVGQQGHRVVDLPDGRRRQQVAAVRVGLAEHGAEVAVRDRELPVQRVVERLVFLLPVPHGHSADNLGGERSIGVLTDPSIWPLS
jgi:hypothetical protein